MSLQGRGVDCATFTEKEHLVVALLATMHRRTHAERADAAAAALLAECEAEADGGGAKKKKSKPGWQKKKK